MTPEELKKFCAAEDDCRYYTQEPFSHGDYTYATDGSIIVRVPRIELWEDDRNKEAAERIGERAARLFAERTMEKELLPIPAVELPSMTTCKDCGGTGKDAECFECKGHKEVRFSNAYHNYESTCETCNGTGKIDGECNNCNGSGKVEAFASTEVGNARFQNKYLFLIAALPNSKIAPDGDNGAYFTFDGGDGLLMPTRK